MLAIAADGNKVLTERLDRFERAYGSEIGAPTVMGILELDGDHIIARGGLLRCQFRSKDL